MTKKSESENQAVKMQRLRRAVERLRRVRAPSQQSPERRSWLKRLLDRLRLTGSAGDNGEPA